MSGFTRGTSALTPSEERQRQFLESRQYDFKKDRPPSTSTTSTPVSADSNMPPDLLNFIKDMGPVIRQNRTAADGPPTRRTTTPRLSRLISSPEEEATLESTTTTLTSSSQHGYNDPNRVTKPMPLAANIPGFDTNRTTNFSTANDHDDDDEDDTTGTTMLQLYTHLSQQPSPAPTEPTTDTIATTTTTEVVSTTAPDDLASLLQNASHYLQIPVLLLWQTSADQSYVGVTREEVPFLLQTHEGLLTTADPTKVRLLMQTLIDHHHHDSSTTAAMTVPDTIDSSGATEFPPSTWPASVRR